MDPDKLLTSDEPKDQTIDSTKLNNNSPEEYDCPISHQPMRLPVITNNALTYDFVSVAEWLCAHQGKNTDPGVGNRPIKALIVNRIMRNNSITLSLEEKTKIAEYCVKLNVRYPKIDISTITVLDGIQQHLQSIQKSKSRKLPIAPLQRAVRQLPIEVRPQAINGVCNIILSAISILSMVLAMAAVSILLIDLMIAGFEIDILLKNLHRTLLKPESRIELALYRFENRCNSNFYKLSLFDSNTEQYRDLMKLEHRLNTLLTLKHYESKYIELGALNLASFFREDVSLRHLMVGADYSSNIKPTLLFAIHLGKVNLVHNLLKFGAKVDRRNPCGQTALMGAAALGDVEMMDILLKNNAHPNLQDYYGLTALHVAGFTGQTRAFKRLLRAGANPNIRDIYNMTAEMYALESKQTKFLFQNLKLPRPIISKTLTKLFQRIKSQETSDIKLHPILLNSTYKMSQSTLFRPNQPLCIETLKNGDSRIELLEELTTTERENANTKCGYPTSPRF